MFWAQINFIFHPFGTIKIKNQPSTGVVDQNPTKLLVLNAATKLYPFHLECCDLDHFYAHEINLTNIRTHERKQFSELLNDVKKFLIETKVISSSPDHH